jgi:hypothetical protein
MNPPTEFEHVMSLDVYIESWRKKIVESWFYQGIQQTKWHSQSSGMEETS